MSIYLSNHEKYKYFDKTNNGCVFSLKDYYLIK